MILAFSVLTAQVGTVGYGESTFEPGVRVPIVMKGGAAERYGLHDGDTILALDDEIIQPGAPRFPVFVYATCTFFSGRGAVDCIQVLCMSIAGCVGVV